MTEAPDIFLSYSRDDQARAKLFAEAFEREGFRVWWDVGLRAGEAYDTVTETALKTAKAVVVLWSKRSVESRWVRAEATLADRNKTLVPAMIEVCERPIMFELTQTAELMHWKGDGRDPGFQAFLRDVQRFVSRDIASMPAPSFAPGNAPPVESDVKPAPRDAVPSLAVLPFTNRSGNPDDEVFAEGIVEDVISALAQGVYLRVLGASATANLKRAAITDIAALGRQLGVRYFFEGNVRRVGSQLRVTTQLLEAATGSAISTSRFERPLAELSALQEELVTDVAGTINTTVLNIEMARAALLKPHETTSWEAVARSMLFMRPGSFAAMAQARVEAERAVAIAPSYAPARAWLAVVRAVTNRMLTDDPSEVAAIHEIAALALAHSSEDALVLSRVGFALTFIGSIEVGMRHSARAVRKAPSMGMIHMNHGTCLLFADRTTEALESFQTAERLMPNSILTGTLKAWQGQGLMQLGRWQEAAEALDEAIAMGGMIFFSFVLRAFLYQRQGARDEALRQIEQARRTGVDAMAAERWWSRAFSSTPALRDGGVVIRELYDAAELRS